MWRHSSVTCRASIFNRRGESDLARAQDYFQQAFQIDPNYARAWAGLAGVYTVTQERASPEALAKWGTAVERALQLGPTSLNRMSVPRNTTGG